MHCTHCGTKNEQGALYCVNDGMPLTTTYGAQVTRSESKFCSNCSEQHSTEAVYCTGCGHSLEKISAAHKESGLHQTAAGSDNSSGSLHSQEGAIKSLQDIFQKDNLLHAAKWSGMAVAALFILTFIISSTFNSYIQGLIMDEISNEIGMLLSPDILQNLKLITASDLLLLGHMSGVSYGADIAFASFHLTTTSGLFLFLTIPAIILILAGYLMNRNQQSSAMLPRLYNNLSLALVYAVLIAFISLFGGASISVPDPSGFVGDITVSASYGFFTTFINALIISLIFTSAGAVLSVPRSVSPGKNTSYGVSISRAAINTVAGLTIMFFAAFITISAHDEFSTATTGERTLVASQTGGYFWSLSQLSSLSFDVQMDYEQVSAGYSVLGGVKVTPYDPYLEEDLKEVFGGYLWLLALIPLAIHFWTGGVLLKAGSGNLLYEIGAYALAFGTVNAALVSITRFSVTTNISDAFTMTLGFSTFAVLLFSSVLAFIGTYAGAMFFTSRVNSNTAPQQAA
ncbi:hypothetical protein MM300_07185 [Evansella sp. LMS18]|uniref:zinc ribbon domain-containing protein n=1 Tax=Evansella sp. LMS18 TaxID=2924033 RepID=UPI0020D01A84|nr:zinc ribbon domain-containing protein [Evansella sp. LMS18]UTR12069.1 hypothetical protein MM300_07185 [Evansella sp. LMS18]